MSFLDILHLALRNLRQAKLRAILTTMGVIVGVAVIVTMMSFGLGLQSNMLARFKALDLFNEIQVFGRVSAISPVSIVADAEMKANEAAAAWRIKHRHAFSMTQALKRSPRFPASLYVEPSVNFGAYVRSNGKLLTQSVGGANIPNAATVFKFRRRKNDLVSDCR
jgi:ABC-type antimicrobial peptide transport system permease subunit